MAASLLGSAAPTPPSYRRRSSHRTPWSPSPSPLMLLPPRTPKPTSLRLTSPWTGLRLQPHRTHRTTEKRGPCRGRGVHASLFGVGAPEALVIGVVALLVFGPKGLAEVARNLGKTLRTFQPTIRELQEVSREFKSTLEQEIGLNDVTSSLNSTYKPTSFPSEIKQAGVDTNGVPTKPYTSEDLLEVTEAQLAASGAKSQTEASIPEGQPQAAPTTAEVTAATSEIRISAASIEINVTPEVETSAAASETAASTEPTVTAEVQTSAAASETAAQTPSSEEVENKRL